MPVLGHGLRRSRDWGVHEALGSGARSTACRRGGTGPLVAGGGSPWPTPARHCRSVGPYRRMERWPFARSLCLVRGNGVPGDSDGAHAAGQCVLFSRILRGTARFSLLAHDALDLAQATHRAPWWPLSDRPVGFDLRLIPTDFPREAAVFGGLLLVFLALRHAASLAGRPGSGGTSQPR